MLSTIILSGLIHVALAQYDYASSSASTTATVASTASNSIQTIAVGQNGLSFTPNSIVVSPGNQVVFQFYPGDHSVVQGSFNTPCLPASASAFYSGYVNSNNGPASQVFTISINTTDPIFFYCSQSVHCQSGMVGVINPSTTETLNQYKAAAASASSISAPSNVQGGTLSTPQSTSQSGTGTSTQTGTSSTSSTKSEGRVVKASTFGLITLFAAFLVLA